MAKRISALLLALILVIFGALTMFSCTKNTEEGTSESDKSHGENEEPKNFGGETVEFLCYAPANSAGTYQIDAASPDADPVINEIYLRNKLIRDNYGININVTYFEFQDDVKNVLINDIKSGKNKYHAVVNSLYGMSSLAIDGYILDFNSIDNGYIQLEKPWWDQDLISQIALKDKVFFLTGDILLRDNEATWAMFFNKDLIQEHNLDNPYELVYNNQWTIDKMYEMLKSVELTHGALKSYDPWVGDQWGMVVQSYDLYQFMLGAGQPMVDNTGDAPVLRIQEQDNIDTFNKIVSWFMFDGLNIGVQDYHGGWDAGVMDNETSIFAYGNALFMPNSISTVNKISMQKSEADYGILPMPKISSEQQEYTSGTNSYHFSVVSIPSTNNGDKLDATCYALEAMARLGKENVTPKYYDRILAHKGLKDEDSLKMLDIIFGNRIYDLGAVFNFNGGVEYEGTLYFYTDLVGDKNDDILSWYNTRRDSYQAGIDALVEQHYK